MQLTLFVVLLASVYIPVHLGSCATHDGNTRAAVDLNTTNLPSDIDSHLVTSAQPIYDKRKTPEQRNGMYSFFSELICNNYWLYVRRCFLVCFISLLWFI
jgi:hypothetical protein